MMTKITNKRGQFFSMYLVVLTLFMCGMVMAMYIYQNQNVSNSLVSAFELLEFEDNLEIYNLMERNLVRVSILEEGDSGSGAAKTKFCEYFILDRQENLRNFLFENLLVNGVEVSFESKESQKSFCINNYDFSNKVESGEKIWIVKRKPLEKEFLISPSEQAKINFPVLVNYVFEKEYEIGRSEIFEDTLPNSNILQVWHSTDSSDSQANYMFVNGKWNQGTIYLSKSELADFDKGLDRIVVSGFKESSVRIVVLDRFDLDKKVYEKEITNEIKDSDEEKEVVVREVRQALKQGTVLD